MLLTTESYDSDNLQTVTVPYGYGTNYTLTFNGYTTGSISPSATAATVQNDLGDLTSIGSSSNVSVTLTQLSAGSPEVYAIRFVGGMAGGYEPAITASGSVTAVEEIAGGDSGAQFSTTDLGAGSPRLPTATSPAKRSTPWPRSPTACRRATPIRRPPTRTTATVINSR